jgi:hypothetical protein
MRRRGCGHETRGNYPRRITIARVAFYFDQEGSVNERLMHELLLSTPFPHVYVSQSVLRLQAPLMWYSRRGR